jgi:hypothetical protein
MKEWQESQNLISLSIRLSLPVQVSTLAGSQLYNIRANIPVIEHNALGMSSRTARIHQESQILFWIDLCPSIPGRAGDIPHARPVLGSSIGIPLVTDESNKVLIDTGEFACLASVLQEG